MNLLIFLTSDLSLFDPRCEKNLATWRVCQGPFLYILENRWLLCDPYSMSHKRQLLNFWCWLFWLVLSIIRHNFKEYSAVRYSEETQHSYCYLC